MAMSVSIVGPDDGELVMDGAIRMRILEDGSTTGHRFGLGETDPRRIRRPSPARPRQGSGQPHRSQPRYDLLTRQMPCSSVRRYHRVQQAGSLDRGSEAVTRGERRWLRRSS